MTQELDGWKSRWEDGRTGWHRGEPNPLLIGSASPDWRRVLVPLCGASVDIDWLADRGHEVVGVEISRTAANQVFERRGIEPRETNKDGFDVLTGGTITIAIGDMFEANIEVTGRCDAVWDRAALIAIPPEMRETYLEVLRSCAPGGELLLVTLDYPEAAIDGPPHSVPDAEVRLLVPGAELISDDNVSEQFNASGEFRQRLHRAHLADR